MGKQLTQKLMAIVVLLVLCVSGHAQTKKTTIEIGGSDIYMTPKDFSADNVSLPFVYSRGEDEYKFTIYDENLAEKKSFTSQAPKVSAYYITKVRQQTQVVSKNTEYSGEGQVTTHDPETGDEVKEFTVESAEQWLAENGFNVREKKETSEAVFFYFEDQWNYFYYDKYGYQYPSAYYKLDKTTSYFYYCYDSYYERNTYSDTWTEYRNDYDVIANPSRMKQIGQDDATYLTQTFFNTDAAFEYLQPIYSVETFDESDGNYSWDEYKGELVVTEKYSGATERIRGYNVLNDAGATVVTFNFDSNFYCYYSTTPKIFDLGGKKYIAFEGYVLNSADEYVSALVVYSIDSQTNAVRQVAMETGMRVNPTIAHRSDMITVSLEGDSKKVRKVRVVNAAGKTVKVVNVPAGQRSIQLNANELSSGLNVVNVEGESANTCKVIVR